MTGWLSPQVLSLAAIIGILVVLIKTVRLALYLHKRFLRPGMDLRARYGGKWAVVTGASDGIGYEYAKQLSAKGFHIVLIARDEDKLKYKIEQLKKLSPETEYRYIVFDFNTWYSADAYKDMFSQLDGFGTEISVLVNNVGMSLFKPFELMPHDEIDRMMKVNTMAVLHLTRHLIPSFLKRNQRSLIINVSSGLGLNGAPGLGVYGATKAFVINLTESLEKQYRGQIDVLNSIPCPVQTNMNPDGMSVPLMISTEDHVTGTLKDVGYETKTAGHFKHDILIYMTHSWLYDYAFQKEFPKWEQTLEKYNKCVEERKKTDPYYMLKKSE